MRILTLLFCAAALTACQTAQGTHSNLAASNTSGPIFSIEGSSKVSKQQLQSQMTFRAAKEAETRGYKIVALLKNSPVKFANDTYSMTATYKGFNNFSEAGNLQALPAENYTKSFDAHGQKRTKGSSKYGGGLFYPTSSAGRAVDSAIDAGFAAAFGRY